MGASHLQDAEQNRLLRSLSSAEYERLLPSFETVSLPLGHVLYEAREPIGHVYFPQRCVISMLTVMEDGATVETESVGNEGLVGLPVFLGARESPARVISQIPDDAKRIAADDFRCAVEESAPLRGLLLRYTQTVVTQISQTAACNRLHSMEERCARWLLMTHDRVGGGDSFPLKQQFLAYMLGVRRATVTVAAGMLQKAGLIHYTRGKITITDRAGLEDASCECYRVIRDNYERLLG